MPPVRGDIPIGVCTDYLQQLVPIFSLGWHVNDLSLHDFWTLLVLLSWQKGEVFVTCWPFIASRSYDLGFWACTKR